MTLRNDKLITVKDITVNNKKLNQDETSELLMQINKLSKDGKPLFVKQNHIWTIGSSFNKLRKVFPDGNIMDY